MTLSSNPTLTCHAAIAWTAGEPLMIAKIEVAPPKAGEVRINVVASCVCHTAALPLTGDAPAGGLSRHVGPLVPWP